VRKIAGFTSIKLREDFMNKLIVPAVIIATGIVAAAAWSQTPPPNPNVKIYYTTPLENDASRTVRLQSVTIPAGAGNQFHRHPGDQWAAVQEGEVTLTIKGQTPRTLKVGDSIYIPRGTVHRNQNLTDKPARSIELNIMDKDKPGLELVNE
jgi:quercetin dioxygenase-like cupin family protein